MQQQQYGGQESNDTEYNAGYRYEQQEIYERQNQYDEQEIDSGERMQARYGNASSEQQKIQPLNKQIVAFAALSFAFCATMMGLAIPLFALVADLFAVTLKTQQPASQIIAIFVLALCVLVFSSLAFAFSLTVLTQLVKKVRGK